ncbi:MAG: RecX family transcriptional regulator [Actinomycetia bacterium]|nr:RecX family transcriptional regulator [Actinomycetes bacterium]
MDPDASDAASSSIGCLQPGQAGRFGQADQTLATNHLGCLTTGDCIAASEGLDAVWACALRYLAYRERSNGEMRQILGGKGFAEHLVSQVVDSLVSSDLINDARFCRLYLQGKLRGGWGLPRVIRKLADLGIDVQEYSELLAEYADEEMELQRAQMALAKCQSHAKDRYAAGYRFLAARGFAPAIAHQALRQALRQAL